MKPPAIDVSQLTLRYGSITALDDLSFGVEPGTITGLLGRNGSGKTSLLSVLASFRAASAGDIRIDGRNPFEDPEIMAATCLIREGGDVRQEHKVSRVLGFTACHRPNWDDELAGKLLDRFEISGSQRVKTLSRGKRSALGVVVGLASRCPLTMFDEVHLGMDAPARYAFYDALLNDYLAHPRTVILSTHLIDEVASLLEHVLVIDAGKKVLHESAEDLRERGATVTGPAEAVEGFTAGMSVLETQRLGGTIRTTVYGSLDAGQRQAAAQAGLEIGPVPLQDLFVHLTGTSAADTCAAG